GSVLLFGSIGPLAIAPHFMKIGYDPLKDLAPITMGVNFPNVLVVPAATGIKTLGEYVAKAKREPGKLDFASTGPGSASHLAGELLNDVAKIDTLHVPYKGSAPAITDLLGNQIAIMFDNMPSAIQHVRSGKLRPIAVTTAKRSSSMPDVPTMEEAGMPGFRTSTWYGLWAPKNTPQDVVQKLWTESRRVLAEPQIAAQYRRLGAEPVGSTPAEFARYIQAEARKWEE
ncbi:Bug family tripartite tricarboxylate transporter substrate binding protein, partial [Pseudomonas aeruginosa]